jgi:hypothetical protein
MHSSSGQTRAPVPCTRAAGRALSARCCLTCPCQTCRANAARHRHRIARVRDAVAADTRPDGRACGTIEEAPLEHDAQLLHIPVVFTHPCHRCLASVVAHARTHACMHARTHARRRRAAMSRLPRRSATTPQHAWHSSYLIDSWSAVAIFSKRACTSWTCEKGEYSCGYQPWSSHLPQHSRQ